VDLVRDLLDKPVMDRDGRDMGRVDSVIVSLRDGRAPRVAAIEIGPSVLARRLWPPLGRWVAALEAAIGYEAARQVVVPVSRILEVKDRVRVDVRASETSALAVDERVRRWLRHIPGAS
jgi:sporulation protein YlmC with PRC-barrel domain